MDDLSDRYLPSSMFLFLNSGLDFDYVIPNRLLRLATIVIAGICVAFSSIVFKRWWVIVF